MSFRILTLCPCFLTSPLVLRWVVCFKVLRVGRPQAVVRPPKARDTGLHRPPSHALSLNSSWQPMCQRIRAQSRDAMEGAPTNQWAARTEVLPAASWRSIFPDSREPHRKLDSGSGKTLRTLSRFFGPPKQDLQNRKRKVFPLF